MSKTKTLDANHYEILFIIANQYTEEEAKSIVKDVEAIINKYGGEVNYNEFWGKKKLAYPIKNNHFGYYNLLEFDLKGDKLPELNENLRLFDKIIRFQIIRTQKRSIEEINAEKEKQEALSKNKDNKKTESKKNTTNKDTKEGAEVKEEKEPEDKSKEEKKEEKIEAKTEDKSKEEKEEKKKEDANKDDDKKEESLKDLDDKLDNILDSKDLIN